MDCGNLALAAVILALAWPAAALIMFFSIRGPLAAFLRAGALERKASPPPAEEKPSAALYEASPLKDETPDNPPSALLPEAAGGADCREIIGELSAEARALYAKIRAAEGAKPVSHFFPYFARNSHEHSLLKALRENQLVKPLEGGSWEGRKTPVVTKFARVVERICPGLLG